jgi:hypothetical protein
MSVTMSVPWLWGLKSTRAPLWFGSLNQSAGPATIRRKGQSSDASTLVPDFPPETIMPADDALNSKKVSSNGAQFAKTIALALMPGTISPTTRRARELIAGVKRALPASPMTINDSASLWPGEWQRGQCASTATRASIT